MGDEVIGMFLDDIFQTPCNMGHCTAGTHRKIRPIGLMGKSDDLVKVDSDPENGGVDLD